MKKELADYLNNEAEKTCAKKRIEKKTLNTTSMNITQARKELEKLGFKFPVIKKGKVRNWGTITAEPFSDILIENNYWKPKYRSVFIAYDYPHGGPYITSYIEGKFRMYKARKYNEYDSTFANIFGHGKTLEEAVKDFVNNFQNKTYNVSK